MESLKNRYFKVLRGGLKRLRELYEALGAQGLLRLDDGRVKHLLRSAECYRARKLLVSIATHRENSPQHSLLLVNRTVHAVNDCLA